MLVVVNLTPTVYSDYKLGVPLPGHYRERLNTDSQHYGGSNIGNRGSLLAVDEACHGQPCHLTASIPPLATVIFSWQAP